MPSEQFKSRCSQMSNMNIEQCPSIDSILSHDKITKLTSISYGCCCCFCCWREYNTSHGTENENDEHVESLKLDHTQTPFKRNANPHKDWKLYIVVAIFLLFFVLLFCFASFFLVQSTNYTKAKIVGAWAWPESMATFSYVWLKMCVHFGLANGKRLVI